MNFKDSSLIAPCGMNCGICMVNLRETNKCPGCRGPDENKAKTRVNCKIKTCEVFKNSDAEFCYECEDFPCARLEHIDKRYRNKYHMSQINNLESIRDFGMEKILRDEDEKWTCSECGGIICAHKGHCFSCGKKI